MPPSSASSASPTASSMHHQLLPSYTAQGSGSGSGGTAIVAIRRISRTLRRNLCKAVLLILLVFSICSLLLSAELANILTYSTRPLWDDPGEPWQVIPHFALRGAVNDHELCRLHGWNLTQPGNDTHPAPRVYDAVIFSVELDLLEIRMRELLPVVDAFVILETNTTFTGLPKPLVFSENRQRFAFAEDKIRYRAVPGRDLRPGESPFAIENEMRKAMSYLLFDTGIRPGDVVLMADVDEIPSRDAVGLLRTCAFVPDIVHLRMNNYVYSFDFLVDTEHWRARATRVPHGFDEPPPPGGRNKFYYGHSRTSNAILAAAGWHCSFCFPRLRDFVFKMTAYSHADRVTSKKLLDPERIQKVICDGSDIFGMLPEAYTYRELIWKWGPAKRVSAVKDLPALVMEQANGTRFKYLLPGGCVREP
ncbi:hypothetical protein HDU96_011089 [Phlyctochytrium bullatum]|nr:hypothetical protein HDU96_011089 [Phlyctochytrium bullatum]